MDCSLPASSVLGIFQARILGIFLTQGFDPSLASPALAGEFSTTVPPGKPHIIAEYQPVNAEGMTRGRKSQYCHQYGMEKMIHARVISGCQDQ